MFCRKCGRQMSDNAAFCPNCGERNTPKPSGPQRQSFNPPPSYQSNYRAAQPVRKKRGFASFLLIAAVVVGIVFLVKYMDDGDGPKPTVASNTTTTAYTTAAPNTSTNSAATSSIPLVADNMGITDADGLFGTAVSEGVRDFYTNIRGNGQDEYTLMIYIIGSDLESNGGYATEDINEMLGNVTGDKLNIVLQTGGTLEWQNNVFDSNQIQRWLIKDKTYAHLQDVGRGDMASADQLTDFIKYCAAKYPADRYSLIFWDHGGGTMCGYGYDENYDSILRLSDIDRALMNSGIKFDFIGYDACLMASIENAFMLEKYADYMIASEELEPGYGWDYNGWLEKLGANTSASTPQIGVWIVDSFIDHNTAYDTLSIVDLREIPNTYEMLCEFMASAGRKLTSQNFSNIASTRAGTKTYADGEYDMIDIVDLMYKSDIAGADAVIKSVSGAVKYRNDCWNEGSYGLSMYYPYTDISNYSYAKDDITLFDYGDECIEFFDRFVNIMAGGQERSRSSGNMGSGGITASADYGESEWYDESLVESYSSLYDDTEYVEKEIIEKGDGFVLHMSDEEWELITDIQLQVFIDDGTGYIDLGSDQIYSFDDDGDLLIDFDNTWVSLDYQWVPFYGEAEVVTSDDDWYSYGYVPAVLNYVDENDIGRDIEIIVYWDDENPYGYVAGYRPVTDVVMPLAKGWKQFRIGDTIDFLCDFYTYDGEYDGVYYFGEQITISGNENEEPAELYVSYEDVGSSDTLVCFMLTDIYQNRFWTETVLFTAE